MHKRFIINLFESPRYNVIDINIRFDLSNLIKQIILDQEVGSNIESLLILNNDVESMEYNNQVLLEGIDYDEYHSKYRLGCRYMQNPAYSPNAFMDYQTNEEFNIKMINDLIDFIFILEKKVNCSNNDNTGIRLYQRIFLNPHLVAEDIKRRIIISVNYLTKTNIDYHSPRLDEVHIDLLKEKILKLIINRKPGFYHRNPNTIIYNKLKRIILSQHIIIDKNKKYINSNGSYRYD